MWMGYAPSESPLRLVYTVSADELEIGLETCAEWSCGLTDPAAYRMIEEMCGCLQRRQIDVTAEIAQL